MAEDLRDLTPVGIDLRLARATGGACRALVPQWAWMTFGSRILACSCAPDAPVVRPGDREWMMKRLAKQLRARGRGLGRIFYLLPGSVLLLLVACNPPLETINSNGDLTPTRTAVPPAMTARPSDSPSLTLEVPGHLVGSYFCVGHESGVFVPASFLVLAPDGTYLEVPAPGIDWPGRSGDWGYDRVTESLEFPQDELFASAEVVPEGKWLFISFLEGETRIHAEEGRLRCSYTDAVPY